MNELADDVSPPQRLLVFGFPTSLDVPLERVVALMRDGIAALKTEELLIRHAGKYLDPSTFLVDSRVAPGNSGSPAIVFAGGSVTLAGMIVGEVAELQLSIAEPTSRIREAIQVSADQRSDFTTWSATSKAAAWSSMIMARFPGLGIEFNPFEAREFLYAAGERLRQQGVPADDIEATLPRSGNVGGIDIYHQMIEQATNLSQRYHVYSQVTVKTKSPGARVKFQTLGERERRSPDLSSTRLTDLVQRLPIGVYYVWTERNGKATSMKEQIFFIVDKEVSIDIEEK